MNRRNFSQVLAMSPLFAGLKVHSNTDASTEKSKTIFPERLKKGDTVGLIAPGSPINPDKFQNVLQNLENLGLRPKYTDTVFKKFGYLAGTDKDRLDDLHLMIADPEVKAIWCIRGGYGCTRLLDNIDYGLIKQNPKIIIGYSDITALLLAIYRKTGLVGFHGPVIISDHFTPFTTTELETILFGDISDQHDIPYQVRSLEKYATGHEAYTIVPGKAKGNLTGGNLSLLVALTGTKYAPIYKDNIVFMEDVGEKPYRVDRMLTSLIQGSDLSKASGIVLGVFNDCEASANESSLTLQEVLRDRLIPLGIPVFYGFTFGHVIDICTFPVGVKAQMDTELRSVTLLQNAVK
ncbi:MAG: LD-carboxypeptidase [Saprospiraceae bacterium]